MVHDFIKERPHLIWWTKDYKNLSEKAVVEATLNYGDFDDVKKLINILGIKKTASLFHEGANQKRCNYGPDIKHYFTLYFEKHA